MTLKAKYNKIEFWILTLVAAALILSLLAMSKDAGHQNVHEFNAYGIRFHFWKHLFLPYLAQVFIYYLAYLSLPTLIGEGKDNWAKTGGIFGLYLLVATAVSVSNTYAQGWKFGKFSDRDAFYTDVFIDSFTTVAIVFLICAAYFILKDWIFQLIQSTRISKKKRNRTVSILCGVIVWALLLLIFGSNGIMGGVVFTLIIIPYILIIVLLHVSYLIPVAAQKGPRSLSYIWQTLVLVFVLSLLAAALIAAMTNDHVFLPAFFLIFFPSLLVLLPLIWFFFKNSSEKQQLQTALGSSEANLELLRAQINPHFLFNALNTLYGTALQEEAIRTGEGIQKLGDMMRFMLHENLQHRIGLAREVDYLKNYIDLQQLRTATSPQIQIQTQIEEQLEPLEISPMLLIPFVENAFKHGISLQQPSFIKTSLHTRDKVLYFDVHNSVHPKNIQDPEKGNNGIGLNNVQRRLELLYPGQHELIIRETSREFFVHLTIRL
ncbi:hypothetical protein GCM10027051_04820 [Niabella terrae]